MWCLFGDEQIMNELNNEGFWFGCFIYDVIVINVIPKFP